jgi:hypothetical protein
MRTDIRSGELAALRQLRNFQHLASRQGRREGVARVADELEHNAAELQHSDNPADMFASLRFDAWRADQVAVGRWLAGHPELFASVSDAYYALELIATGQPPPPADRLYSASQTLRATIR